VSCLLAVGRDSTVSDIVREAIDRLLAGELQGADWASQLSAVQARLQARLGERSDEDVAEALASGKARRTSGSRSTTPCAASANARYFPRTTSGPLQSCSGISL
jgi:Arc/MetJ-type ribon-helix-helix transcriptional regulator